MSLSISRLSFLISVTCLFFSCKNAARLPSKSLSYSQEVTIKNKPALDSLLDYYVDEGFYPFIYTRLEHLDGSVMYEHSAVNAELMPNNEVHKDSWMRIWSMSKIVTITIALDLIEEGLLDFDDPVTKYIPEFRDLKVALTQEGESLVELEWDDLEGACPVQLVPNDSVMTILHLLTHKAGFHYATTGVDCLDTKLVEKNLVKAEDSQEFIDQVAELPLIMHPGTKYYYGTNTTILGFVIERIAGKSLKELVEERITLPLEISGLQYGLPDCAALLPVFTGRDSLIREAVRGELDIFGPDVPDYDNSHKLYLGGEGMVATADGYTDFLRMLLRHGTLNGERFLDRETVEDIYAPHAQLDNPYGHDGYNLWVSGDSMLIKKTGDIGLWIGGGYECTHFWVDPKRDFVGVILSQNNEVRSPGYEMNDKFRGLLYENFFSCQ